MTAAAPVRDVEHAPTGARRRGRRVRVVGAALAVLVGVGLAAAWWLGARSAPSATGGGWWSEDMEQATSAGLTQSHQVFRCAPGQLETRVDLVGNGPVDVTVTDVRVPLLDDLLALDDRVVRGGTQMVRDPNGSDVEDLYDLVDFRTAEVGGSDWARLVLTWDIRECPQLTGGYLIEDRLEVTYVALGMTHTVTVPLVAPMALTSMPLDELP